MSWIYDLILIALFVSMVFKGWRQGMISALMRLLGWAVAVTIITTWGASWAQTVYTDYVETPVVAAVESAIPADALAAMNSSADALDSVQTTLDSLSGILGSQSVSSSDVSTITSLLRTDGTTLAQAITQTILEPVLVNVIQVVLSIIILVLCLVVFNFISRLTASRRMGGSIANRTNRMLGGVMGFVEALITGYIYVYVLSLIASFITADWLSMTILQSTVFVRMYL